MRIKVGIVGCGFISRRHIEALKKIKECEVSAVCDINRGRAEKVASRYNIPHFYTDISHMLNREKLDVVHILTPPQSHKELAIKVMEAGCHVLVEKPLCVTVQEANQMIQVSKKQRVKLGVIHSFLYHPVIRKLHKIIQSNFLGELVIVDMHGSVPRKGPSWFETLPGKAYGEFLPHHIYTLLSFIGQVDDIKCYCQGYIDGIPTKLSCMLRGSKGMAILNLITHPPSRDPHIIHTIILHGTEGIIKAIVPYGIVLMHRFTTIKGFNRMLSIAGYIRDSTLSALDVTIKFLFKRFRPGITHDTIIKEFIEAIKENKNPPITAEKGKETVKITENIIKEVLPNRHY